MREKFGQTALFFFNEVKSDYLYIIWKPKSFLPEKFTVLGTVHKFPGTSDEDSNAGNGPIVTTHILNIPGIVSEIFAEGKGVFADLEFK
jgi:hypothetical protein